MSPVDTPTVYDGNESSQQRDARLAIRQRIYATLRINQQAANPVTHNERLANRRRTYANDPQRESRLANRRQRAALIRQSRNSIHFNLGRRVDVSRFEESTIPSQYQTYYCGNLYDKICTHCHAYKWPTERSSLCCLNGTVTLVDYPEPPTELMQLYNANNATFFKHIRAYNNIFALASMGCGAEITFPGFTPTFTIQGKIYHRIGNLLPVPGEEPKFAQIYFSDTENEKQNRLNIIRDLDEIIIDRLQTMFHEVNPYIPSIKSGIELMEQSPEIRLILHANSRKKPSNAHRRLYNLPTGSEVAALLPGDQSANLDIILHNRDASLRRINTMHRSYDALHYVLIYPHGTDGYEIGLKRRNNFTLSATDFYSYRFQMRQNSFNLIMRSRRLMQQYAVDMWAKIEGSKLNWVRNHQKEIRAEKYNGLMDAHSDRDLANAGRKVILPPTIYGTPRWYHECYQNAMAIVRKYSKPDIFITFTCNPRWVEIQSALNEGESYTDRPDLCVRVFKMKVDNLMKDLTENSVLGKVEACTSTIEFQKRGLPHVHILLILQNADKPLTPEMVDKIVCAEIPDKEKNPILYEIITKNNLHGPCGVGINPNCPCMVKHNLQLKCSKQFPKSFNNSTILSQVNYPQYRRRSPTNGGKYHRINKGQSYFDADNSWVVPYNPLLSLRYNAHINVEIVHSAKAVKYLYKYLTKGQDRIIIQINPDDEVEQYENARYISASEAFWRIYKFPLHYKSPAVLKLDCHLPGEHLEYYEDGSAEEVLQRGQRKTMLQEYFKTNDRDPYARTILYPNFPEHYVWIMKEKTWKRREKHFSIGRIPIVALNAHQAELYYLRLLLYHKTGATSFENLRTINGYLCNTFQEACKKLELLESDDHLDEAMEEAYSIKIGDQLRDFFINLLLHSRPTDPKTFWMNHKDKLCEDYVHQQRVNTPSEIHYNMVLNYIQDILDEEELDLEKNFDLPKANRSLYPPDHIPRIIAEETSYDITSLQESITSRVGTLNNNQRQIYDQVIHSVDHNEGRLFALQASAGTGKTYTMNLILDTIRSRGFVALGTALSGIAATLLHNGRTLHKRAKIPINITETSTANFTKRDATGKLMQMAKILVIDEVSMGHKYIFEALDRSLRDVRNQDTTFGGLTVLLAADWKQCLPIINKGSRGEIINACLKGSYLWKNAEQFSLTTNMRVTLRGAEVDFSEYLTKCGAGKLPLVEQDTFRVNIPENMVHNGNKESLCDWVFENLDENYEDKVWMTNRAIICPTNEAVDEINKIMINKLTGQIHEKYSFDKVEEDAHLFPTEFLNSLTPSGMPPHTLNLKVGSSIMLLRNMDTAKGHCNGTKYVLNHIHSNVLEAEIVGGAYSGNRVFIPRITLRTKEDMFPFIMSRKQFPVRPCFAMTSNKAQGQSLERIGLYLKTPFFSHGQYYVAQSRVGSSNAIEILSSSGSGLTTDNVVYHEIL